MPQVEVEVALKPMVGKPTTFMKSVAIEPDPSTLTVAPVLAAAGRVGGGDRNRLGVLSVNSAEK